MRKITLGDAVCPLCTSGCGLESLVFASLIPICNSTQSKHENISLQAFVQVQSHTLLVASNGR